MPMSTRLRTPGCPPARRARWTCRTCATISPARRCRAKTHLPRGAKNAAHRAAGLRAQTGRVPPGVRHEHRFDFLSVDESQEVFARQTVGARDLGGSFRSVERILCLALGARKGVCPQPADQGRQEVCRQITVRETWNQSPVQRPPQRPRMRTVQLRPRENFLQPPAGEIVETGHGRFGIVPGSGTVRKLRRPGAQAMFPDAPPSPVSDVPA